MKRLIFLLILVAIGVYQLSRNNEFLALMAGLRHGQIDQARIEASRTSLGYQLKEENWIEFPLAQNVDRLKLITQATIPREMDAEGALFTYGLEYQIIGSAGKTLLYQNRYHHTTRVSRFIDTNGGAPYSASMYLDPHLIPADGRVLTLNSRTWSNGEQATSIRIRMVDAQPGITDALLRMYQREQRTEPEDLADWQRLSIYKRERLARGNLYPHSFLSDEEKRNLLSNRWRPLGPIGIAGVDYEVRRLYTLKEVSDTLWEWQEQEIIADISAEKVMSFSTGTECGRLRLSFTRLPGISYPKDDIITLNWYGSSIGERDHKLLEMNDDRRTLTTVGFTPGLLELRSANPYMVALEQQHGEQWVSWEPERTYAVTHLFDENNPIEFKLAHHETRSTPIRVTLRAPMEETDNEDISIAYQLLGTTSLSDNIQLLAAASFYDRIIKRGEQIDVSEPAIRYLEVPAEFHTIRFSSPRQTLVSVATRSPRLSHLTRVPVDVNNYTKTDPDRLSAWFSIRPGNYQERHKNQLTRLVFTQQRPPVDDPDLAQGNYLYESLRPSKNWAGRHLLLPPAPDPPVRAPNPRSVYHLLTAGRSTEQVQSKELLHYINPTLVYINRHESEASLSISVNDKPYFSTPLFGPSGRLHLPPLETGTHRLNITITGDVTLLMNHLKRSEPGHLLRFATHLVQQRLIFDYVKKTSERDRLSFLFFSSSTSEPSTIRVRLEGVQRSRELITTDQFTLTNRHYEISPTDTAPVEVLNDNDSRLGEGQRFLFPIGADIPSGRYRIVVDLERGPKGYLILSRVEPGSFSYRSLAQEPHLMETTNEPSG